MGDDQSKVGIIHAKKPIFKIINQMQCSREIMFLSTLHCLQYFLLNGCFLFINRLLKSSNAENLLICSEQSIIINCLVPSPEQEAQQSASQLFLDFIYGLQIVPICEVRVQMCGGEAFINEINCQLVTNPSIDYSKKVRNNWKLSHVNISERDLIWTMTRDQFVLNYTCTKNIILRSVYFVHIFYTSDHLCVDYL